MAAVSNPTIYDARLVDLVTLEKVAESTGIRIGTLRVWETRGKIARMPIPGGTPLYHLPTVQVVVEATPRKFTPSDPAANARRSHARAA